MKKKTSILNFTAKKSPSTALKTLLGFENGQFTLKHKVY
jgi:hypothetical protein